MRKQTMIIITTILLLATAGILYMNWGDGFGSDFGAIGAPSFGAGDFHINFDSNLIYQSASDELGFYILERRSIRRYDVYGQRLWERTMSHANPVFVQGGHYIGVGAHLARAFYVFGPDGLVYRLDFDNDILSYHVACNGYSAILSVNEYGRYYIEAFNAGGTRVMQRVLEERNLFPISMAISPDASTLIVSYLDMSGHNMLSYICAYDMYDGTLFASFRQIEGEIISRVLFIDDDYLMFSSVGQLGVYRLSAESRISYVWSKEFEAQAVFVEVIDGVGIAVAYGQSGLGAESAVEDTFVIYSLAGDRLAEYFMSGGVRYLSTGAGAAIIGGGPLLRDFIAIDYSNEVVWRYTATSDVLDFVILDTPQRALITAPTRMQIMEVN